MSEHKDSLSATSAADDAKNRAKVNLYEVQNVSHNHFISLEFPNTLIYFLFLPIHRLLHSSIQEATIQRTNN